MAVVRLIRNLICGCFDDKFVTITCRRGHKESQFRQLNPVIINYIYDLSMASSLCVQ